MDQGISQGDISKGGEMVEGSVSPCGKRIKEFLHRDRRHGRGNLILHSLLDIYYLKYFGKESTIAHNPTGYTEIQVCDKQNDRVCSYLHTFYRMVLRTRLNGA